MLTMQPKSEVQPDNMRPTAPLLRGLFLAPDTPHLCMFLGFVRAQACENSPQIQVVTLCASVWHNFFCLTAPVFAQRKGSVARQPRCLLPPV